MSNRRTRRREEHPLFRSDTISRMSATRLLVASAISLFGDSLRGMTLLLWIFGSSSNRALGITLLTVVQTAPALLVGIFLSSLIMHHDRVHTMIVCALGRFGLAVAIVGAVASGPVWIVLLLVFLSTGIGIYSDISLITLLPALFKEDELVRVNGLFGTVEQASFVVGPALGAVMFVHIGPIYALAIDAVTFLLLALILGTARLHDPRSGELEDEAYWTVVRRGWSVCVRDGILRWTVSLNALRSLSAGINSTAMIFMVTMVLGYSAASIAWLGMTNGIFQMIAGGLVIATAKRLELPVLIRVGVLLMAVGGILVAGAPTLWVLVLGVLVTSLGNSPANIAANVTEQKFSPPMDLAVVRGIQESLLPISNLLGAGLGGIFVVYFGARGTLWWSAAVAIFVAIMSELLIIPRIRSATKENVMDKLG